MKSYQVRIASGIRDQDHATRKRETDTRLRVVVAAGSSARLKAETFGGNHAKQGPVGVKKVVSVRCYVV